jgi:phage repressor protein C with HTH and peptisase S24 domain
MQHTDFWRTIDAIAAKEGIATSRLAIKAGLNPTTFNVSKRIRPDNGGGRWPSTESIAAVLEAANMKLSEFAAILEQGEVSPDEKPEPIAPAPKPLVVELSSLVYPSYLGRRHFNEMGNVKTGIAFYALKITNDSMAPIYKEYDVLWISPGLAIKPNHKVVVFPKTGAVLIGNVINIDSTTLTLDVYQDQKGRTEILMESVDFIHKIEWLKQ